MQCVTAEVKKCIANLVRIECVDPNQADINLQRAHPHVAESDVIAVILQLNGARFFGIGRLMIRSRMRNLHIVVNQHAVMKYGNSRIGDLVSGFIEARRAEHCIITLPRLRRSTRVNQRRYYRIQRTAVIVFAIQTVGVQDLYFIGKTHKKDAAVRSRLPKRVRHQRQPELHVKLTIAKYLLCHNVGILSYGITVLDFPTGGIAIAVLPLRKILAIEKHDSVRRHGFVAGE